MAYDDNAFCWHGIVSLDPARATAFYPEVLGWSTVAMDMGGDKVPTFLTGEVGRAHVATAQPGDAPRWNQYLRVDDVDARTEAAVANGGTLMVAPTDIPPGRFSVVTSPSGAPLHLFHEADEASSRNGPSGPGSILWVELWSSKIDADLAWLSATFGFETKVMPMPTGPYHILEHGGAQRGGAMPTDDAPPHWLAWVEVTDVDATAARAVALGGTTLSEPFDVPTVGRMAVIADPDGARFGIMNPAA